MGGRVGAGPGEQFHRARRGPFDEDGKWWNQYILKVKTRGLPGGLHVWGVKEKRIMAKSQRVARALGGRKWKSSGGGSGRVEMTSKGKSEPL